MVLANREAENYITLWTYYFIHGNYPAQFRHIAPRLGNIKEHRGCISNEQRRCKK